jgi:hypothetical protein
MIPKITPLRKEGRVLVPNGNKLKNELRIMVKKKVNRDSACPSFSSFLRQQNRFPRLQMNKLNDFCEGNHRCPVMVDSLIGESRTI